MPLGGLEAGASFSFTINADDRLIASDLGKIRVSGFEMQGTVVTLTIGEHSYSAVLQKVDTVWASSHSFSRD